MEAKCVSKYKLSKIRMAGDTAAILSKSALFDANLRFLDTSQLSEAPRRKSMHQRTVASRGAPDTALRLFRMYLLGERSRVPRNWVRLFTTGNDHPDHAC